jgi:hypothetical protein
VEAAIDTSKYAFIPDPGTGDLPDPADTEPPATSGDLSGNYSRFVVGSHNIAELLHGILEEDTDGNGTPDVTTDFWWYAQQNLGTYTDGDYQLEKNGTHDWTLVEGKTNSETWGNYTFTIDTLPDNNPPTGWGKYIKLVNPWNDTIQLDDGTNSSYYRLYFTGQGRGHYWDTATHTWTTQNMTIGTADGSGGYIELEGEVPARGHFIIIDGDNIAFNVPSNSDHYQVEKTLNYLLPAGQEIVLEKTDTPGVWDSTAEVVTVMTFTYPDTNSLERDDDSLSTSTTESVQIGDPRPSWYRNGDQSEPWGPDAWVTDSNKTAEWNSTDSYWDWGSTDTTQLGWFNKNWQDGDMGTAGIQPIGEGDYPSSGSFTEQENVDNLLESFPPVQEDDLYTGVTGDNTKIMNNGILPSPGAIGFVHAGISWGTVSLTNPSDPTVIGATDIVYLKNFTDYLVGPVSPYENGVDDDGDDSLSADNLIDDDGAHEDDRFGPEIRLRGKVNVNTAPEEVLKATFKNSWLEAMWNGASDRASAIANAIVNERNTNGPYSSVDDFFNRNLEIFEVDIDGDDLPDGDVPNSARREALARFMYNLVTVRTDVWGVVGKVRIYDDNKYGTGDSRTNNNQCDDGEEIASQTFHMVVDRSFDPPRIVLRKSGD